MSKEMTRDEIINLIIQERLRQMDNPNNLDDQNKTKNDWAALVGYYLFESSSRPDKHVSFEEFRSSLIKASAVILAALETSFMLEDKNLMQLMTKMANIQETTDIKDTKDNSNTEGKQ